MAKLDLWRGPFDEDTVQTFLQDMREGAALHVYRKGRTASGQEVPDLRGWFLKESSDRFAAMMDQQYFVHGDELDLASAVAALRELSPEYVIHNT